MTAYRTAPEGVVTDHLPKLNP